MYAVDIQPEMLRYLRAGVEVDRLTNVKPVLDESDDPRLAPGFIDWILLVDLYYEFQQPKAMLAKMREALKRDGKVALLE